MEQPQSTEHGLLMPENPRPGLPTEQMRKKGKWETALVGELLLGLYQVMDDARNENNPMTTMSRDDQELLSRVSNALSQQNEALLYIAEFPQANAGIPAAMQVEMMARHAKEWLVIE